MWLCTVLLPWREWCFQMEYTFIESLQCHDYGPWANHWMTSSWLFFWISKKFSFFLSFFPPILEDRFPQCCVIFKFWVGRTFSFLVSTLCVFKVIHNNSFITLEPNKVLILWEISNNQIQKMASEIRRDSVAIQTKQIYVTTACTFECLKCCFSFHLTT